MSGAIASHRWTKRRANRAGAVLFIVTIVIGIVTLSAYAFLVLMQTENRAAHLHADQTQTRHVLHSGREYLRAYAALPRSERIPVDPADRTNWFQDVVVDQEEEEQLRRGRFSVLARTIDPEMGRTEYQFGTRNLSERITLSALLSWESASPGAGRQALMNLPGMDEAKADALLDWIDPDDEPREFGAESEFYQGLDPPRMPANRLPTVLEQLLEVRGISSALLLESYHAPSDTQEGLISSSQTTQDHLSDPSGTIDNTSMPADTQRLNTANGSPLEQALPLSYYLAVTSGERNESFDGFPRIDLNQSDLTILHAELADAFDESVADFVVALRQFGPTSSSGLVDRSDAPPPIDLTRPATHSLQSVLDVVDVAVRWKSATEEDSSAEDSSEGSEATIASPFSQQRLDSLTQLVDFCDRTTTESTDRLTDRIHVGAAPREVLLGIPGMTPEIVEAIVAARETTSSSEDRSRVHPVWLFAEGLVPLDQMKSLLPWVTMGGDMIEAEIVAYYDEESPWMREQVVIDGSKASIPLLNLRDLRRLGRGFAWQQLTRPTDDLPTSSSISQRSSP